MCEDRRLRRTGHGWVEADVGGLYKAFDAKNLTIRRKGTGKDIRISVRDVSTPTNPAAAMLNGSPDQDLAMSEFWKFLQKCAYILSLPSSHEKLDCQIGTFFDARKCQPRINNCAIP